MLHKVTQVLGQAIGARDGDIGAVEDLYFDDDRWGVRYLVVNTGGWLFGREVLISPVHVRHGEWTGRVIRTGLSRREVEESPPLEKGAPVSRRFEAAHAAYYGYPLYWRGPYLWGPAAYPVRPGALRGPPEEQAPEEDAVRLRSCAEVIGYDVRGEDGGVGHLDDLLLDDDTWDIPYLVVDRRSWLPGGHVLLPRDAVARVDWSQAAVEVAMTREAVKRSPPYT